MKNLKHQLNVILIEKETLTQFLEGESHTCVNFFKKVEHFIFRSIASMIHVPHTGRRSLNTLSEAAAWPESLL